jgi:hypothetical protein
MLAAILVSTVQSPRGRIRGQHELNSIRERYVDRYLSLRF